MTTLLSPGNTPAWQGRNPTCFYNITNSFLNTLVRSGCLKHEKTLLHQSCWKSLILGRFSFQEGSSQGYECEPIFAGKISSMVEEWQNTLHGVSLRHAFVCSLFVRWDIFVADVNNAVEGIVWLSIAHPEYLYSKFTRFTWDVLTDVTNYFGRLHAPT